MTNITSEKLCHALHVMSSVESMRTEELLCDFMVKVGIETFNTHRLILAANSGYFKSLFSSDMKEVREGYVTMNCIEPNVMKQCIEYMYTSTHKVDFESVPQVLEAANFLQILQLQTACFRFLTDNLSPENSLFVLNLARTFNNQDVEEAAESVIQKNLEIVMSTKLFTKVIKEDLLRYISTASPETSWKAITTWCKNNEKDFPELAEKVKFEEFPFQVLLADVLNEPLVSKSSETNALVVRAIFSDFSQLQENLNNENCFLLKTLAPCSDSKEIVVFFIKQNFSALFRKPGFCALPKQDVIQLLKSPEVKPEECKWDAILNWMKCDLDERETLFLDLFHCIDLDKLSVKFLKETVRQEKLVFKNAGCMEVLVDAIFKRCDHSMMAAQMVIGTRVARGVHWKWNDEDGNGPGTVITDIDHKGLVEVEWDNGGHYCYRMGTNGAFDLIVIEDSPTQPS